LGVEEAETLFDCQEPLVQPIKTARLMKRRFLKLSHPKFYLLRILSLARHGPPLSMAMASFAW